MKSIFIPGTMSFTRAAIALMLITSSMVIEEGCASAPDHRSDAMPQSDGNEATSATPAEQVMTRSVDENSARSNRILIVHASYKGSTAEVAMKMKEYLAGANQDADVIPATDQTIDLSNYDLVILGSAIHAANQPCPSQRFAAAKPDPFVGSGIHDHCTHPPFSVLSLLRSMSDSVQPLMAVQSL